MLASGSDDGTVRIWDATTGEPIGNIPDHSCNVDWIEFSPDSRLLASIYHDGTIKIWDLVRWTLLHTLRCLKDGHRDFRWNILFSPDSKMIASAAYKVSNVTLWEAGSGECLHSFTTHSSSFHRALAFSPKGELLATATDEYEIILWSTKTGRLQHKLPGHQNTIHEIRFSPDGRMLACPSAHDFCMLWDTETGRLLHKITTKSEDDTILVQLYSAAFSPDGTILAFGTEDSVSIWDTASGQLIETTSPPLYSILRPLVITFFRGRLEVYLSSDREKPSIRLNARWVLAGTKKLLQLPSDYHSHSWAIYKNTLAIGDVSGRVTILRFEEPENGYAV
jgi:WD40 repeat protein